MSKLSEIERVRRIFPKYEQLLYRLEILANCRPKGRWGIAVDNDEYAIEYQQRLCWRLEVMRAFLHGRKPNPYVKRWYKPAEEAQKGDKS